MKKDSVFEIVFQQANGAKSRTIRITIGSLLAFAIIATLVFVYLLVKK